MKKMNVLMLCSAVAMSGALYANDAKKDDAQRKVDEVTRAPEKVGVIRYTVTIYKDRQEHNKDKWGDSVRRAASTVRSGEKDSYDRLVDEIAETLRLTKKDADAGTGIHGEIRVSIGDGECPEGCCGDDCHCGERYAGNCPCSANSKHACMSEKKSCRE